VVLCRRGILLGGVAFAKKIASKQKQYLGDALAPQGKGGGGRRHCGVRNQAGRAKRRGGTLRPLFRVEPGPQGNKGAVAKSTS